MIAGGNDERLAVLDKRAGLNLATDDVFVNVAGGMTLTEPAADLAVVANLVVTNEAEEKIYLQEYFGEPPDQYQLARFFLMQQVAQIFYGMVFLLLGSSGKPIDWSETGSRIQGLSSTHLGGRDQPGGQPHENVCGRVHWEQFLQNTQQAR